MKKVIIGIQALLIFISSVYAEDRNTDIIIKKEISVYSVPLKALDTISKINNVENYGELDKKIIVNKKANIVENKKIIIIFKSNNKKEQILALIDVLQNKIKSSQIKNSSNLQELLNIVKQSIH